MRCEQCKDRMFEYVENMLSEEQDKEMKAHIEECEQCMEAYKRELIEAEAFKEVCSYENVEFNSSVDNIINSIDKNKYRDNKKNRRYPKVFAIAAVIMIGLIITPMVIDRINNKKSDFAMDGAKKEASEERSQVNNNAKTAQIPETELGDSIYGLDGTQGYAMEIYQATEVSIEKQMQFNTPFIATPDGKYEATIEGKGETAVEEGQGVIYIKNKVDGKMIEYKMLSTDGQQSPCSINWYDDRNLMIVQGNAHGTLVRGLDIITLNAETSEQTKIYSLPTSGTQRIKSVERIKNDLKINYVEYDDIMNEYEEKEKLVTDYKLGKLIE